MTATPEQIAMARRWMATLPREQFDMLLVLTDNRYEDGLREATELAAKLADDEITRIFSTSPDGRGSNTARRIRDALRAQTHLKGSPHG